MFKLFVISLLVCVSGLAQTSLNANLLYNWQDTTLPGSFFYDNVYNEVWGYSQAGREYAIIGATDGTHFFDITDPQNVQKVAFVQGAAQGGVIVHRDYHDYNGYLYAVSDEGNSTLQIMDLTALPTAVPVLYDSDALFNNVHNIFIDTAHGLLYACSVLKISPARSNAMEVYSLSNPVAPALVYTLTNPNIGHIHDAYVLDNMAYLNAGFDGLFVYDFADASNPVLEGVLSIYPFQGYNHSGWLLDDGKHYVFIDETEETLLKVVNIEDFSDIEVVSTFGTGTRHSSPHNVIVDNCLAYVSYYYDGLRVYNLSDPANPVEVAYYDTYSDTLGASPYEGAWGVYPYFTNDKVILSDMQTGMYVFEIDIPATRPVADFSSQTDGTQATFTDQSTGSIDQWLWTFMPGGNTSNLPNATFDFGVPGTYEACLSVSNMAGCSIKCDTIVTTITTNGDQLHDAAIAIYPTTIEDYFEVELVLPVAQVLDFAVFDAKGAIILQSEHLVPAGRQHLRFEIRSDIAAGSLLLHVTSDSFEKGFKLFKSF